MGSRRATIVVLVAAVLAEAILLASLLGHSELRGPAPYGQRLLYLTTPCWLVATWAVWRLRPSGRRAVLLVLGVGAALGVIAVAHPPSTSDDDYRYMWDAKVQLSGVDPYRHPPSSGELDHLRDASLFGPPDHCRYEFAGGCTSINRPTVRTIYPPVAEGAFAALRVVSFGGQGNHLPLQIAGLVGSLAVGLLLLRRVSVWAAVLWTWSPLAIVEYANNAHIDWLAVLLVALAFLTARRTWVVGALVGAAIAVKVYPALVLPALLRRSWLVVPAAVAVIVLGYVPHVLAVGTDVIGYLPGYLKEEDYTSGERLLLLGAVLPHPADTVVGVLILAAVCIWAWRRGSREHPERAAVVVVGVAFCVVTPSYGWYAGVLLVLVAITGALEWLPIVLAPAFAYLDHGDRDAWIYLVAVVLALMIATARHRTRVAATLTRSRAKPGAASGEQPRTARVPKV